MKENQSTGESLQLRHIPAVKDITSSCVSALPAQDTCFLYPKVTREPPDSKICQVGKMLQLVKNTKKCPFVPCRLIMKPGKGCAWLYGYMLWEAHTSVHWFSSDTSQRYDSFSKQISTKKKVFLSRRKKATNTIMFFTKNVNISY